MHDLSQRLGSKRAYLLALVTFTAGSALCGFAGTLPLLILFRILQGLGGAILLPLAFALILTIFPTEERGVATALTPYWQFDLILAVIGLAFGMIQQPLRVAAMTHIHGAEPVTNGSTLLTVSRAVAASLGLAVLATLVQTQMQVHKMQLSAHTLHALPGSLLQKQAFLLGMQDVFLVMVGLALLGLMATALLQKKPPRAGGSKSVSAPPPEQEISVR